MKHFQAAKEEEGSTPRVIIFVEYRESVAELEQALHRHKPLIRVVSFVGQGVKSALGGRSADHKAKPTSSNSGTVGSRNEDTRPYASTSAATGMKQTEQNKALHMFRQGVYNTLVSTSIGEEGSQCHRVQAPLRSMIPLPVYSIAACMDLEQVHG